MVKMTVPKFAHLLQNQVANATGTVRGGEFKHFRHFCDLLAEHYTGVNVDIPSTCSSMEVANELKKLGNINMPSGMLRKLFDEQVELLRSANIENLHFNPILSGA